MNDQDIVVEQPTGKSINIIDKTPEAEDLINNVEEVPGAAPAKIDEPAPVVATEPEPIAPVEPVVEEAAPVEPADNKEANFDADHARSESDEEFYQISLKKLAALRKERNELIVEKDKKEDEIIPISRELEVSFGSDNFKQLMNKQREIQDEIFALDRKISAKKHTINGLLGVIKAM